MNAKELRAMDEQLRTTRRDIARVRTILAQKAASK